MTAAEALAEIEYYDGFSGKDAKTAAVDEACLVACAALDKQIPKAYVMAKCDLINYSACPECNTYVNDEYCPHCGQKIDWGNEE